MTNPNRVRTTVGECGSLVRMCTTCEEVKPLTSDNFYVSREQGKHGFNYRCRPCERKRYIERARAAGRKERVYGPQAFESETGEVVKPCADCGEVFPLSSYRLKPGKRGSFSVKDTACRKCLAVRVKSARDKSIERYRLKAVATRHGLTPETVECMHLVRRYRCDICGEEKKGIGSGNKLNVDHCHDSMEVRGLLCGHCNKAIGLMADDPTRLRAAALYLERSMKKNAA